MAQRQGVAKGFVDRHLSPAVIYIILSVGFFATLLVELHSPAFSPGSSLPPYFVNYWTIIGGGMIALGPFALGVLAVFRRRLKSVIR